MVKRGGQLTGHLVSSVTPMPPSELHLTLIELATETVIHRIHLSEYGADQFNPGVRGNARFSPIKDVEGNSIHTLYGGTTIECALMETIFRDVPYTPGFKSVAKETMVGQVYSTLRAQQTLKLVDLTSPSLRKLGVPPSQLIDTERNSYPFTRKWAEAIHGRCLEAQGLHWVSRQDNTACAVILFGDRIPNGTLQVDSAPRCLINDPDVYDAVLDLAEHIGVNLVPGKS